MFRRWNKVPCILEWTIKQVDIKQQSNSLFELSWVRGKSKGTTDRKSPDESGIIYFNSTYECPCTMYISKSDSSVRVKNVKVLLNRYLNPTTCKVYGKLSIDVGRFYGKTTQTIETIEMESGRSTAPSLTASFILRQIGQAIESQGTDEEDLSFMGDVTDRVKIRMDDWDQSVIEDNNPQKKKKKKHTKTASSESPASEEQTSKKKKHSHETKTADQPEGESANQSDEPKKKRKKKTKKSSATEEGKKKHKRSHKSDDTTQEIQQQEEDSKLADQDAVEQKSDTEQPVLKSENDQNDDTLKSGNDQNDVNKIEETPEADTVEAESKADILNEAQENIESKCDSIEDEPKSDIQNDVNEAESKCDVDEIAPKSDIQNDVNEAESKCDVDEIAPKSGVIESELTHQEEEAKSEKVMSHEEAITLLESILAQRWPEPDLPSFLDSQQKWKFPPAVFPIFATFLHTHIFESGKVNADDFSDFIDTFSNLITNAPLSDRLNSNTKLLTICLLYYLPSLFHDFDTSRVSVYRSSLTSLFDDCIKSVISPLLLQCEVLLNRFSTAKFDLDPLLSDFSETYHNILSKLAFPSSVTSVLVDNLNRQLDARILNKIVANPNRLLFSNAVIWNSFLTAFDSTEHVSFNMMREAINTLMLAYSMATEPSMRTEICPSLDVKLVIFLMRNLRPDALMPMAVNCTQFAAANGVPQFVNYEKVEVPFNHNFSSAMDKLKLAHWNAGSVDEVLLESYPFLADYIAH